jgi:hypothetical protein
MTPRGPRIRSLQDLLSLSEFDREERTLALRALRIARDEGISIEVAANEVGTDIEAVKRWAGEALRPVRHGYTLPTETDRIVRFKPLAVEGEVDLVAVVGPDEAALADEVFDVQWRYINGEATPDELRRYQGVRVAGRMVEVDPATLDRLALGDQFDIEELYRELL